MEPQSIIRTASESAMFLILTIDAGREETVRDVLTDVNGLRRSVGFRVPESDLGCVTGIGSEAGVGCSAPPPRPICIACQS